MLREKALSFALPWCRRSFAARTCGDTLKVPDFRHRQHGGISSCSWLWRAESPLHSDAGRSAVTMSCICKEPRSGGDSTMSAHCVRSTVPRESYIPAGINLFGPLSREFSRFGLGSSSWRKEY